MFDREVQNTASKGCSQWDDSSSYIVCARAGRLQGSQLFYVAGIAVLNSLWIAALYLLVNVLTNLEEYKGLWKEWNRWLKMRSMR